MTVKSLLIVLNAFRYTDDSLIAECYSESEGRVSMLVRISHSPRAAVRHTLFTPMAILKAEWTPKPRGGLVRPKSACVHLPQTEIPFVPAKSAIAMFTAEFLLHAVRHEPASAELFRYVAASVEWLDACPHGYANFHLVFLLRLTLFLGIAPNIDGAGGHKWFDLQNGEFVGCRPVHHDYLEPNEAKLIPQLMRMNFATMHLFRLTRAERNRLLGSIIHYYRLQLPSLPELKSPEVLSAIFD